MKRLSGVIYALLFKFLRHAFMASVDRKPVHGGHIWTGNLLFLSCLLAIMDGDAGISTGGKSSVISETLSITLSSGYRGFEMC